MEMFTTPRRDEVDIVKHILYENKIPYYYDEKMTEYGWRYCICVPLKYSDEAYVLIDEGLSEVGL